VFKSVVEILQEFDPTRLPSSNLLWIAEILKVFVVSADANSVCSTQEQGATAFKAKNYRSEFLVIGVVVLLSRTALLTSFSPSYSVFSFRFRL